MKIMGPDKTESGDVEEPLTWPVTEGAGYFVIRGNAQNLQGSPAILGWAFIITPKD